MQTHKKRFSNWRWPDIGALFLINGPSGVGKITLAKALDENVPNLTRSVSVTTRQARGDERAGTDYRFVSQEEFAQLREDGLLLEYTRAHDEWYGTLRASILQHLQSRTSVVAEVNNEGVNKIRDQIPEAVSVFILPPYIDALRERLVKRQTEDETQINMRVAAARDEIRACGSYDYIIMNNDLDTAYMELESIVIAELTRTARRGSLRSHFRISS